MSSAYHGYNYRNSSLIAVPAVHHNSAFAKQVNKICRNPQTRPDAIAVELGHSLVLELVSFLRELNQDGKKGTTLPCMLGIMKRNSFIHNSFRERTLLLQKFYRSPVNELPDDLLAERLNFSKWSTLFISPADSIIEAVRCSIELDIPVYGVDLSDFASTITRLYSIEDPQNAHYNITGYGNRVMQYCHAGADPRIDLNREIFMASGLKFFLTLHRKLLFTCGMAHWKSILTLLDDDSVLPYPVNEINGNSDFKRVIVHPALAAPVMEMMPQVTFNYEKARQPVNKRKKKTLSLKPEKMIRNCLDAVYKEYTSKSKTSQLYRTGSIDWTNIEIYEQYLFQLAAVRQRKLPDMSTMLDSAKAMMDDTFCKILIENMMAVNPDWVSEKDFPDLPVIKPAANNKLRDPWRSANRIIRRRSGSWDGTNEDEPDVTISCSGKPDNQAIDPSDLNKYWKWDQEKENRKKIPLNGNPWIWPPCESLTYGIAFQAAEISNFNQKRIHDTSIFEGSMQGGIDVKATMRSFIRGEKKIYVSKLASDLDKSILNGINPDPFVLIFPVAADVSFAQWAFYTAGSELGDFVKDPQLFERITYERGNVFASSVLFEEKISPPSELASLIFEMSKSYGAVMFGNPCINAKQSAIWLESSGYKCCPILPDYGMSSLISYYSDNYNIYFDLSEWEESLIRMAIPFAKKMVTIIASDLFKIPELAIEEASRKRIQLNIVSYSNFSESQLEDARHHFSICTIDKAGLHFPPETEALLGHKKETNFEMLPYEIRKQVEF